MKWEHLKEYQGLVIQTNLSPTLNSIGYAKFQILIYFLQLSYFLIEDSNEQIFNLIKSLTKISLISPYFMANYSINILIGVCITILNFSPYVIITYRYFAKSHRSVASISKSVLDITTIMINNYFLNFTWLLYVLQLYYICWNLLNSLNPLLLLIAILNVFVCIISLMFSTLYFVNYEFFEQNMRRHFNYTNVIAQLLLLPLIFISLKDQIFYVFLSKALFGVIVCMQVVESFISLPFGFSAYAKCYNNGITTFLVLYIITTIQRASSLNQYTCIILFLILFPVSQYVIQSLMEMKRQNLYQGINSQNQYFELIYIENIFELNLDAQKNKAKEFEFYTKFSMHYHHCRIPKCQCRKIGSERILQQNYTVQLISCLFKRSFDKHKVNAQKRLGDFEVISLKFLTFINKFKRNGPKTYQELKVLFQKQRDYTFYFVQMCLFLQFTIQAQMQKDEDYNINSEGVTRISNVKLMVSKSERSIVQNLYQMEQVKQHMLPLLIQICAFKSTFWKHIQEGKIANYTDIEKQLEQLQILKTSILSQFEQYSPIFMINGRTYNVQFLKFHALIELILNNNARAYYEMEKDCKEILAYEKSMSTFEITNINFFKGDAISVKVCIAFGPNIGKVRNEVISPLIPRFFGFPDMDSFINYTGGNINPLMPNWLLGVHDEMMQNYIRRGSTQRIGKYFQTFAKLCDQTLIRCQVYLAHNFSQDLEADFSMIGCLKRLEQDDIAANEETKRLKNLIFKGQQHVLFDMYGNLMGITQGLYKMIERMQRKPRQGVKTDDIKPPDSDEESSKSNSEVFDVYEIKWSDEKLTIEDFYLKVLIWMMFPFITAEMEQTGIEFLMNGQVPPKGRYPNLIDLESSNTVVSNKETYMFVPEDVSMFVQQYNKVLGKINEDEKIQTNTYSISSRKQLHYVEEAKTPKQQVTVFNEKICNFFFEEHLKKHQSMLFGTFSRQENRVSNMNKMSTSIAQSQHKEEDGNSDESSEQIKTRAEQMYYDKFLRYTEKITPQDFNPVPIIYSINYEEFRYKKNEIENKVQMFVIEVTVNEQQLVSMEKGYRKQLRETLKQMQQLAVTKQLEKSGQLSKLQTMQQSKIQSNFDVISQDSASLQGNLSEKDKQDDTHDLYQFMSHPSKVEEICFSEQNIFTENGILTSAKDEQNKLLPINRKSIQLYDNPQSVRSNMTESQYDGHSKHPFDLSPQGFHNLKDQEKEIASRAMIKISQKNRQQQFFNENEQKVILSNHDRGREKIENEDQYLYQLKNFDENYKAINQKISEFQYPKSYKFQNYLLTTTVFLVITYILLVSIAVWNQFNYSDCMDLIQILLSFQQTYSQITHGLFRIQYTNEFNITNVNQLILFYEQQMKQEISDLITFSNDQNDKINDLTLQLSSFYDIENTTLLSTTLTDTISQSLASFYKVLEQINSKNLKSDQLLTQTSIANVHTIGQMPELAYNQCYDSKISYEQYYQQLLIIFMVVIFLLVLVLQFSQMPLISALGKYKKKLYMALLDVNFYQISLEYESFEVLQATLKKSVYDWMMIDFIVEGKIFDLDKLSLNGISQDLNSLNNDNQNQNKQEKNKLLKKLKSSNMSQFKYIVLLITGLIVIMSYFLVIFLLIFILSDELLTGLELLFSFKMVQSSFINVMTNADIVAYNTLQNATPFYNLISQTDFETYTSVLTGMEQESYISYGNNILGSLTNPNINAKIQYMNEQNICNVDYGLDCSSTLVASENPNMLVYYQQGLKQLFTQVQKQVQQYPQFYQGNLTNNQIQDFVNYVQSAEHLAYLDYGTEILINAQNSIVEMVQLQFETQLSKYQQTLIIFILTIGSIGLVIKSLLGRILMRLQKQSIDTCQASLLLLSPRRYTQKSISKLITQII